MIEYARLKALINFVGRKINLTQNQNRNQNNIISVKIYLVFFNKNIDQNDNAKNKYRGYLERGFKPI